MKLVSATQNYFSITVFCPFILALSIAHTKNIFSSTIIQLSPLFRPSFPVWKKGEETLTPASTQARKVYLRCCIYEWHSRGKCFEGRPVRVSRQAWRHHISPSHSATSTRTALPQSSQIRSRTRSTTSIFNIFKIKRFTRYQKYTSDKSHNGC